MKQLESIRRATITALVLSQVLLGAAGCREQGSAQGPGGRLGAVGAASGETQRSTLGEIGFRILRRNLELSDPSDNPAGKVAAFDARHGEFVAAVDTVVPPSISGQLSSALDDVARMVDEGTLPALTGSVASILELLANDPQDPRRVTLEALAKLSRTRAPIGKDQALKLAGRLLAYPELDELLRSIAAVIQENDGQDAQGRPNAERDLVGEDLDAIAATLRGLSRPAPTSSQAGAPSALVRALLEPIELRGGLQVGAPAWAVRADANGNPKVRIDPATGRLYAPFVDRNGDGAADVDADGDPVDARGAKVSLAPFGTDGNRDQDGRLVDAQGRLVFDYFDAKRTALGQLMLVLGKLVERDVPLDLLKAVDATATRVTTVDASGRRTVTWSDDNPAIDLAWSALEIFRYRDAPKLLDSLARLIRNDPARAERIMVHLVNVIHILDRTPFRSAPSGSLLDDMVPLLDRVFESNGGGQSGADSVARDILDTFRTEIQRLRRIPRGLAEMMKYSDYAARTPAAPGLKSSLEQLMDMMAEANGCDSWPFGNMAEFYLDAMAGNKRILGLTINVHTINQLLDISILRALLCSRISPQNIRALHAFAQSGALDALIPVVKAFSDRGQTRLLKNMFLTLGSSYPGAMRPNEPLLVEVLESGMVEELFDALNQLATMTVPGTGERVTDVTAQFIAAVVDVNRTVRDRRGNVHRSLLHSVVRPLEALGARIDANGVRAQFDRAIRGTIDVALETTQVVRGTTQNPVVEDALLYHGLVKLASGGLETLSSAMSMDPVVRNQDITRYQQDVVSLMTGRGVPLAVDTLLAVERSPSKARILDAVANIFRPNLQARNDIYGSVVEAAATLLQARGADPAATVDVLRFAGRALDPARGWSKPIVVSLVRLLGGARQTTITQILRNALDKGPNGTSRSPVETLLSILDDVKAASPHASQAVTAQSIADAAAAAARFIRDRETGLESIYANLRARLDQ